jgi:hypothetical protein
MSFKGGAFGGWPILSPFSADERRRLHNTTPVRNRRETGFGFPGGRPFSVFEGSGFWCSLRSLESKPAPFEKRKGCGTPIKFFNTKGFVTCHYFIG